MKQIYYTYNEMVFKIAMHRSAHTLYVLYLFVKIQQIHKNKLLKKEKIYEYKIYLT